MDGCIGCPRVGLWVKTGQRRGGSGGMVGSSNHEEIGARVLVMAGKEAGTVNAAQECQAEAASVI